MVGLALATTAGCGAEHTAPAPPAATHSSDQGRGVDSRDDGAVLHLRVGENADLIVRDPSAADPVVVGDAVTLVEIANARPSGLREWEIRALRPGSASIRAQERGDRFTITVTVAGS